MLILSSRSATVLVIFVIAIVAFCLASVCGSMTGTISIFPNATDDSGELYNSSYTEYKSYGSEYQNDYGSYDDSSKVEESNDDKSNEDSSGGLLDSLTGHSDSGSSNVETTTDSSSNVETTTDSGSSNVETTTDSGSRTSGDDTA